MVGARREHLARLRGYGFRRVEIVVIPEEDWAWLPGYLETMPHGFSIHTPALRDENYPENPLKAALIDPDPARRRQSLEMMRRELDRAAEWGARHVVVHLERNLLMFDDPPPAGWGEREGLALGVEAVGELLNYSRQVGVPVHLENLVGSPLCYSPEAYRALAEALPEIRYCLDIGHAALNGRFFGFPERELAEAMAPNLTSLHVYDNHLPPTLEFSTLRESGLLRKYPVHPDHQGLPTWIDTPGCLEAALRAQPDALVTFEVYFRLDEDPAHTAEGIAWTIDFCRRMSEAGRGGEV
jgi:sugar phosphate isomerase/epimerase